MRTGDVGSVCGRWTTQMITLATPETAELTHDGRPYAFVRRDDEDNVPWLASLMRGAPVLCLDPSQRPWMMLDAFTFTGMGRSRRGPPLDFLLGRSNAR